MVEIICKNCKKKCYVLKAEWMHVEACPFCCMSIEKEYEIQINSFEDALREIFLSQGFEILMEKRKLIAYFMDIYKEYKQEVKIISNFCSEDMLEKIYNSKNEISLLEREVRMMKSDMVSNGISEKWAQSIGESFYNALKDIQGATVCLPNNFRLFEESIENSYQEMKESLKDSIDIVENEISSTEVLLEKLQEHEQAVYIISNEEIGELVYKFILQDKVIHKDKGDFKEKKINVLKKVLKVPDEDVIFLMHDDTLLGSGKNGYMITNTGIYCKALLSAGEYISWKEFVNGDLQKMNDCELILNGKILIYHTVGEKTYIVDSFFFELQEYLQENIRQNIEK